MLSFFKSQQPPAILAFFALFILLKIPFFIIGVVPVFPVTNLWNSCDIIFTMISWWNVLLAQLCLFAQAIWFNYLFHKSDYHESSTMLPALYFTLLSSCFSAFNVFSIYTIVVFILLMLHQTFITITVKESTRLECFNVGALGGLLCLIDVHFIVFIPFLFLILLVLKPFRFNEYLMLIFGILFPVYMALSYSYLTDTFLNVANFNFSILPQIILPKSKIDITMLIIVILYLFFSLISIRDIFYSIGFRRRKNLYMLFVSFIGFLFVIISNKLNDLAAISVLLIPMSCLLALLMLRIRKKRIGEILNAIFVIVIIVTNIIRAVN